MPHRGCREKLAYRSFEESIKLETYIMKILAGITLEFQWVIGKTTTYSGPERDRLGS